jgi:hypothetical protein
VTHGQDPSGDFHHSPIIADASESHFVVDAAFIASDQKKFAFGFFVPAPWMLKRRTRYKTQQGCFKALAEDDAALVRMSVTIILDSSDP